MSEHTITPKTGPDAGKPRTVEEHATNALGAIGDYMRERFGLNDANDAGPVKHPSNAPAGTDLDQADRMSAVTKGVSDAPGGNGYGA